MRFYKEALGGTLEQVMTIGDSPMAAQSPPERHHQVMHAHLSLPGGGTLFGADSMGQAPYEGIKGVSIALAYEAVAEAEHAFNALADGGEVRMPLQPVFWAKMFGMLTDRFGTPWLVNGGASPA